MKATLYTILLTVSLPAWAELPKESAEMIKKLNDWEREQLVELQERISEKRSAVISVLQNQLEQTTKSGNLEGALAIKNEIEKLKALPAVKADPLPSIQKKSDIVNTLVTTKWVNSETRQELKFTENGKVSWVNHRVDKITECTWEAVTEGNLTQCTLYYEGSKRNPLPIVIFGRGKGLTLTNNSGETHTFNAETK